ncbi:AMP-binding protein [Pseudonocardia benzenivorans]
MRAQLPDEPGGVPVDPGQRGCPGARDRGPVPGHGGHARRRVRLAVVDVDDPSEAGWGGLASASAAAPPTLHARAPSDEFCIVYTSGTTGAPKGILFDAQAVATHAMVAGLEYGMSRHSRWLTTIPHNSSVQITLAPTFFLGGAVGFLDGRGFDPHQFAAEATTQAATHTYLVPTQLYRVLEAGLGHDDVATLTSIGYGAAPIAHDRVGELVGRFGPVFSQLYGMAEIASIATMLTQDDHRLIASGRSELMASAGRASFLADVRVVDADGRTARPASAARSASTPRTRCAATTGTRRRRRRRWSTTGSGPATWACSTTRATSTSSTG